MRVIGAVVVTAVLALGCTAPESVRMGYDEMLQLEGELASSQLELISALPQTDEVRALAAAVGEKHRRFSRLGMDIGRWLEIQGIEESSAGILKEIDGLVEKINERE